MKRLTTLLLVLPLLAVAAVDTSDPAHSPGEELWQVESGRVELPTRFIDGESGFPGAGRRVYNCTQESNGLISYIFDVWAETWGGPFVIGDVVDETGTPNIDVFFYAELADCALGSPVTVGEFASPDAGEVGFVPDGARYAVVFMPSGLGASFTYSGYTPPEISIASDSLDLTVAGGATVVWENDTDDYAYVTHVPGEGQSLEFDSSPRPGTGIRVGDTFSHTFRTPGTYTYETPIGTGTITVTG